MILARTQSSNGIERVATLQDSGNGVGEDVPRGVRTFTYVFRGRLKLKTQAVCRQLTARSLKQALLRGSPRP